MGGGGRRGSLTSFLQLRAVSDMLGSPFSKLVQYRMCLTILAASFLNKLGGKCGVSMGIRGE